MKLNDEQRFFIKDLLQNELVNLKLKRSKAESVAIFDEIYGKRMAFIKELIKQLS